MVLPPVGPNFTPADIYPFFGGQTNVPGNDDRERMVALGLAMSGPNVANGPLPMTWLRRPGGAIVDRDKMIQSLNGSVQLWAFDRRGRAIDPGAVACWWSWLLNTGVGNSQLLAPSITTGSYPQQGGLPVVALFAAQQTLHLTDGHEGPLTAPFINGRLLNGTTMVSDTVIAVTGNGPSLSFSAAPAAGPIADNPAVDNAPRPRIAVLPVGTYGGTANPWPGGPVHAGLTRDFVRAAVVEEESLLTGLSRRDSRLAVTSPTERRQSAQNRPSTRINVNRTSTATGVLLANSQVVADALLALPTAVTPTRMVLGIADFAWGGTPGVSVSAPGTGPLPATLTDVATSVPLAGQYRVQSLIGGGALAAAFQTVLVEVNLGLPNAGAWVRAWPLGFDLTHGEHMRMSGGAGRADVSGLALLTMVLPNGLVAPLGLLGMDILVALPTSVRVYGDCRFARPAPVTGTPATTIAGTWVICEAGTTNTSPLPAGSVPPGGHVVLTSTIPPTLVDRTAIPATAWDPNTLGSRLIPVGDIVSLTEPAFDAAFDRADPDGRPLSRTPPTGGNATGGLNTLLGGRLHRLARTFGAAASAPYALLDRLEVAAATPGATPPLAVIGASPPVPWELSPASNFAQGFLGVPAGFETHGTGVTLSGSPAIAVAEYVRERTAGLGFGFISGLTEPLRSVAVQSELAVAAEAAASLLPLPADGAGAGPVVAVLRTAALGLEGLPGVAESAMANTNLFPFSQNELALEAWLNTNIPIAGGAGTQLRNAAGTNIDSMTRALDRRLLCSAFGARELLTALLAAIGRAQDFIYIETPGVDNLTIESGGENVQWWQALINRMNNRRGLQVALCVSARLTPGTPQAFQDVRNHTLADAIEAMRNSHGDRFAVFSPGVGGGRALRLASTSVVVDDLVAFTGTTHLTRRGLSWDSSLAAAVFDERITDGRPTDVRAFRIQLMSDRLGIPTMRLPSDPAELVTAIRTLDTRGSGKLSAIRIRRPATAPANTDLDIWNPDGSKAGLSFSSIATLFAAAVGLTDSAHAVIDA